MQTWLVHMRQPVQLFRTLGPRGFLTFQIVVGGNAMVALVHPLFVKTIALEFIALIFGDHDLANVIRIVYFLAIVAAGYSFSMYLGWRGLSYRKVPKKFRVLAYTPAHWMLLSCAAWWAAFELVYAPFRWNKTEHGLEMTNLLVKLNHHLTDLVKRGELPQIWGDARDSAAGRQRPLPAAV
jgi:glycosyltransferase XagB